MHQTIIRQDRYPFLLWARLKKTQQETYHFGILLPGAISLDHAYKLAHEWFIETN